MRFECIFRRGIICSFVVYYLVSNNWCSCWMLGCLPGWVTTAYYRVNLKVCPIVIKYKQKKWYKGHLK